MPALRGGLADWIERLRWRHVFARQVYLGIALRTHPFAECASAGRVRAALNLLQAVEPRRIDQVRRALPGGLAVDASDYARAWYDARRQACFLGARHAATGDIADLALSIVHETSHARLERCGFEYRPERRLRLERLCLGQEIVVARRLAVVGELTDERVAALDRSRMALAADQFSEAALAALQRKALVQRARTLGQRVPRPLRRLLLHAVRRRLATLRAPYRRR